MVCLIADLLRAIFCGVTNKKIFHLKAKKYNRYREFMNVWEGIIGHRNIGPYFIDDTLNTKL